jgi:hypothetical protein
VFLESAVPLTKSLHRDIVALGKRLETAAAAEEENSTRPAWDIRGASRQHEEIKSIIAEVKSLLARIDRDIPLIQLAITASGETMSNSVPPGISPSRLMQASTFLSMGDTQFASDPTRPVQIGPTFIVSCYMLFVGHSGRTSDGANGHAANPQQPETVAYGLGEGQRKPIWQEVMHKARVRLCRTPVGWRFDREIGYCPDSDKNLHTTAPREASDRADEYAYHLEIVEDLDDGRLHAEEGTARTGQCAPYDKISMAGIRESVPVHEIAKIFYTDTGKILNVGTVEDGEDNPVLLLKRDVKAAAPTELRRECGQEEEEDTCEEEEMQNLPAIELSPDVPSDTSSDEDEQSAMDRQLRLEGEAAAPPSEKGRTKRNERRWQFAQHVDPEWIALEVYTESPEDTDSEDDESQDNADADGVTIADSSEQLAVMKARRHKRDTSSVDSNLLAQIRNISLRSGRDMWSFNRHHHRIVKSPSMELRENCASTTAVTEESQESFVARSPFGAIVSSLSLMEILIRLTSMQEFQQTSHLAIPDHILTFFLEETSTTGLRGEQRWKARSDAKRRVGFDPYTDTPSKED